MSIIAVPSMGNGGLNDEMSPRFGRCASFTFVELENDEIKAVRAVPNPAANAMGGAGVQATQIIGNNGASVVIVGFLGPNAANGLNALNIKILQAPNEVITIKEIINLYLQGKLPTINTSNVGSHYGMGSGRGMG
ncbi:MAG: NifB/NifX family molybdenum-iron cluster-binding protein, partial [Promethearchaeota archaeon]